MGMESNRNQLANTYYSLPKFYSPVKFVLILTHFWIINCYLTFTITSFLIWATACIF